MNNRFDTVIERDGGELPIVVEYDYSPGHRGKRDSITACGRTWHNAGPPLEPDEPASIEIVRVTANGDDIELTASECQNVEDEIMDALADEQVYAED